MSLPARKQPGAARRRKKAAHLRRVKRRLLGLATPSWSVPSGQAILEDVKKMIKQVHKDRRR